MISEVLCFRLCLQGGKTAAKGAKKGKKAAADDYDDDEEPAADNGDGGDHVRASPALGDPHPDTSGDDGEDDSDVPKDLKAPNLGQVCLHALAAVRKEEGGR